MPPTTLRNPLRAPERAQDENRVYLHLKSRYAVRGDEAVGSKWPRFLFIP